MPYAIWDVPARRERLRQAELILQEYFPGQAEVVTRLTKMFQREHRALAQRDIASMNDMSQPYVYENYKVQESLPSHIELIEQIRELLLTFSPNEEYGESLCADLTEQLAPLTTEQLYKTLNLLRIFLRFHQAEDVIEEEGSDDSVGSQSILSDDDPEYLQQLAAAKQQVKQTRAASQMKRTFGQ